MTDKKIVDFFGPLADACPKFFNQYKLPMRPGVSAQRGRGKK
jgi:hypothetical protein